MNERAEKGFKTWWEVWTPDNSAPVERNDSWMRLNVNSRWWTLLQYRGTMAVAKSQEEYINQVILSAVGDKEAYKFQEMIHDWELYAAESAEYRDLVCPDEDEWEEAQQSIFILGILLREQYLRYVGERYDEGAVLQTEHPVY